MLALIGRDLRLALRQGVDSLMALAFFVLAVVLFPFGVGPEPDQLARIGAGIIWVAALFSAMLSLERLFQGDYEDGTLDLMALAPMPLSLVAAARITSHWLISALPLLVIAPVLGLSLHLPAASLPVLVAALALGTPTLSLIGGVGATLILGARRGGVLLALLVLPLYIPVLIFGVAAVDAVVFGLSPRPHLAMLLALLLVSLVLAPVAAGAALRQALD
jgi:heme exporter protein B